jgi:hypothetical protein
MSILAAITYERRQKFTFARLMIAAEKTEITRLKLGVFIDSFYRIRFTAVVQAKPVTHLRRLCW